MQDRERDAREHEREPGQEPEHGEYRAHQRQRQIEYAIGIEQRHAHGQRAAQPLDQLSLAGLFRPFRHLFEIGWDLALKQISGMQLGEQVDRLVLSRGIVLGPPAGGLPDVPHRPPAVHEAQHQVGDR